MAHGLVPADVGHLAVACSAHEETRQRHRRRTIAKLGPVAEISIAPLDATRMNHPMSWRLCPSAARTMGVGQPGETRDVEDVVMQQMVMLARRLVDAVDVGGRTRWCSSTGKRSGRPYPTRACVRRGPSGCAGSGPRASTAARRVISDQYAGPHAVVPAGCKPG